MTPRQILSAALLALPLSAAASAATLLVANKSDHTVDLIEVASGRVVARLATDRAPHEVAVSPDGALAAVSNYGDRDGAGSTLTVVDVARAEVARSIDLGPHTRPHGLAWVSPRELAVTAEGSGHLLLVDAVSGELRQAVATGQQVSHMVVTTPDGRRAFVANIGSGSVTVIDLAGGRKLADVATGEGAEGLAITPDGGEVWVSNRAADTLTVLDAASLEVLATLPCAGFPIRVEITPDGTRALVSAARSGEVVLFDTAARRELARGKLDLGTAPDSARRLFGDRFGTSSVPVGIEIAPDGSIAWIAATQADAVAVVSSRTLEVLDLIQAGREPDGMALSGVAAGSAPDPRADSRRSEPTDSAPDPR